MGRWLCLTLRLGLACALGCGQGCRSVNVSAGSGRADSGDTEARARRTRGECGAKTCKYFKAICYEGYRDGQMPGYGPGPPPTCAQVQQDLIILAPYTPGIRTYNPTPTIHDRNCIPPIAAQRRLNLH